MEWDNAHFGGILNEYLPDDTVAGEKTFAETDDGIFRIFSFYGDCFRLFEEKYQELSDAREDAVREADQNCSDEKASGAAHLEGAKNELSRNYAKLIAEEDTRFKEEKSASLRKTGRDIDDAKKWLKKEYDKIDAEIREIDRTINETHGIDDTAFNRMFHAQALQKWLDFLRQSRVQKKELEALKGEKAAASKKRIAALSEGSITNAAALEAKHKEMLADLAKQNEAAALALENNASIENRNCNSRRRKALWNARDDFAFHADELSREAGEAFAAFTGDPAVRGWLRDAKEKRFSFACDSYQMPEKVPEWLDMGTLACRLPEDTLEKMPEETADKIRECVASLSLSGEPGGCVLPFLKKSVRGTLSYFQSGTSEDSRDYLHCAVLSRMMQFRPGKLYVYMINPLFSTVFTRFDNWGKDKSEIINGGIKETPEEIEALLKMVRSEVSRRRNNYQSTQLDACYENETSIFLCIMDFPAHFTASALESLSVIEKTGKGYGINILIAENGGEMEQLLKAEPKKKDKIEEIKHFAGIEHYGKENDDVIYSGRGSGSQRTEALVHCFPQQTELCGRSDDLVEKIRDAIRFAKPDALKAEDVISEEDFLTRSTLDGIDLPLGQEGADQEVTLTIGRLGYSDIRQHVLIEGATGGGKSVLLHAIISSAISLYRPEELQLILLDFKEGVEFKPYADHDLPSVRIVCTKSERAFGQEVFELLTEELDSRQTQFKEAATAYGRPDLVDYAKYREITGKPMPQILLIIDEFSTLLGSGDAITDAVSKALDNLVKQGRSAGIHVILGTQSFSLPGEIMNNMAVRIALNGSQNILENSEDISKLDGYSAIFNDERGKTGRNRQFQVMFAKENLGAVLGKIEKAEKDGYAGNERFEEISLPKKIFYTNIADLRSHPFNRMIRGEAPASLTGVPGDYAVFPGESISFRPTEPIVLGPGNNLLVGTRSEKIEDRIINSCIMGMIYSDTALMLEKKRSGEVPPGNTADDDERTGTGFKLITWIDFSSPSNWKGVGKDSTQNLVDTFAHWINYFNRDKEKKRGLEYTQNGRVQRTAMPFERVNAEVKRLYAEYTERKNRAGAEPFAQLFVILTNADAMAPLNNSMNTGMYYAGGQTAFSGTALGMLREMLTDGSLYGINFVVTCRDYRQATAQLGPIQNVLCATTLAAGMSKEDMSSLVMAGSNETLSDETAVVYDSGTGDRGYIRIFEEMSKDWLLHFKEALDRIQLK